MSLREKLSDWGKYALAFILLVISDIALNIILYYLVLAGFYISMSFVLVIDWFKQHV
jgi:hypothetical protein